MHRAFSAKVDDNGQASINLSPYISNKEWDIYQITLQTETPSQYTYAEIYHNTHLLTWTVNGWQDTATGFPNTIVGGADTLMAQWMNGIPGDQAKISIWYNERDTGTSRST